MKYKLRSIGIVNISKILKKIGNPINVPKPDEEIVNKIIDDYYDNKKD